MYINTNDDNWLSTIWCKRLDKKLFKKSDFNQLNIWWPELFEIHTHLYHKWILSWNNDYLSKNTQICLATLYMKAEGCSEQYYALYKHQLLSINKWNKLNIIIRRPSFKKSKEWVQKISLKIYKCLHHLITLYISDCTLYMQPVSSSNSPKASVNRFF